MKRHEWITSTRAEHSSMYEECRNCNVERFAGRWHSLKRPDRYGVTRKWRKPHTIRVKGEWTPGDHNNNLALCKGRTP